MLQVLKDKLNSCQKDLDDVARDRDELSQVKIKLLSIQSLPYLSCMNVLIKTKKKLKTKLESDNSILIQEVARLKSELNEKNSQM